MMARRFSLAVVVVFAAALVVPLPASASDEPDASSDGNDADDSAPTTSAPKTRARRVVTDEKVDPNDDESVNPPGAAKKAISRLPRKLLGLPRSSAAASESRAQPTTSARQAAQSRAQAVDVTNTAATLGTTVVPAPSVSYVPGFVGSLSVVGEVDTNARRVAIDPKASPENNPNVEADALMRGQLSLAFALVRPKQQFNLRLDAGGKMFAALATERMGVAQLQSNVDILAFPSVALYGRLFSKVRAQVSLARSYTIHRADIGANIGIWGPLSIRPSIYGAGFHGVGTPQFSSAASGVGLGGSWRISAQERADVSGDVGIRAYPFAYPVDSDGEIVGPASGRRIDAPLRATLAFSSARLLFFRVSYTVLRNASTSFGESYTRHRFRALLGTRLPAQVTLSAQASLQLTAYDQGVSVGQRLFLADDDESQNVLTIKLARPLLEGIVVEGRVAFYGNELAREGVRFSRTTLSVGLRADL